MSIRDEARQEAERRWPEWLQAAKRDWLRGAFEAGAVWASEQADREPSDLTNDEWATLEWALWFLKRKHGYSALSSRDGSRVKFDDLTTKIRTAQEVRR